MGALQTAVKTVSFILRMMGTSYCKLLRAMRFNKYHCGSINKWVSKMQHIHVMEYYSALRRTKMLTHATTWMNPEDVMLSDISQTRPLCGNFILRIHSLKHLLRPKMYLSSITPMLIISNPSGFTFKMYPESDHVFSLSPRQLKSKRPSSPN